jgi:uncharacterized membrane protein YdfJ with MMPL/SSD domain
LGSTEKTAHTLHVNKQKISSNEEDGQAPEKKSRVSSPVELLKQRLKYRCDQVMELKQEVLEFKHTTVVQQELLQEKDLLIEFQQQEINARDNIISVLVRQIMSLNKEIQNMAATISEFHERMRQNVLDISLMSSAINEILGEMHSEVDIFKLEDLEVSVEYWSQDLNSCMKIFRRQSKKTRSEQL